MIVEVFESLHRAELGSIAQTSRDLLLPRKLELPAASPTSDGKLMPNGNGSNIEESPVQQSLVQTLFGMDIQVVTGTEPVLTGVPVLHPPPSSLA